MTEETIIDGVNVAGCDRHCSDNHNIPNRCYSDINESYRDCKPKEYQCNFYVTCLEQERDELKKACEKCKLFEIEKTNRDLLEQIDVLEQENKELKEENKQHIKEKQILNERLYCYAYEKDCHLVCKQQDCLLKNSYKYLSALEEINRIIKLAHKVEDYLLGQDYTDLVDRIEKEVNEVLK